MLMSVTLVVWKRHSEFIGKPSEDFDTSEDLHRSVTVSRLALPNIQTATKYWTTARVTERKPVIMLISN